MTFFHKNIFNDKGQDNTSDIWLGPQTGIMQLNTPNNGNIYSTGVAQGLKNFWVPEKVSLALDILYYEELEEQQRIVYDSLLAYLTYLDSVQVNNIPELSKPITCPKTKAFFATQSFQEVIHSASYQYMIETLIPANKRDAVYNIPITDKALNKRCKQTTVLYQKYLDDSTPENYYIAMVANYLLEGLYFYSGFMYFYTLNQMPGTINIIKYINRDELFHVKVYEQLLRKIKIEFKIKKIADLNLLDDLVYEMFSEAVNNELEWCNYIFKDKILGINSHSSKSYLEYLSNDRLKNIGLEPLYSHVSNPYKHLDKLANLEDQAPVKQNFFETEVTEYNVDQLIFDNW